MSMMYVQAYNQGQSRLALHRYIRVSWPQLVTPFFITGFMERLSLAECNFGAKLVISNSIQRL